MFLSEGTPFPDNPACKRCISKPCTFHSIGNTYPVQIAFIHHTELRFDPGTIPDFIKRRDSESNVTDTLTIEPDSIDEQMNQHTIREIAEEAEQKKDEKDDASITNPRWKPVTEDAPAAYTCIEDTIRLFADVKNYPEDGPVRFDIYDCTGSPAFRIATVSGKNKKGIGSAEWKVDDPNQWGSELRLEFDGAIRNKTSGKAPIPVKVRTIGGIHLACEDLDGVPVTGVTVTITSEGKEIYSGKAAIGELGLCEIPFTKELTGEFNNNKGTSVTKILRWNGGKPPYTKEVIVFPCSSTTEEAA